MNHIDHIDHVASADFSRVTCVPAGDLPGYGRSFAGKVEGANAVSL
jgi:hypothetical protein